VVVQYRVALCRDSRFFSVRVRKEHQELARRVPRYVRANGVRCIPRVLVLLDRVRSALVQDYLLRDPSVQAAVRVRPRDGRDSATFRVA
jgi:hypothetical protein